MYVPRYIVQVSTLTWCSFVMVVTQSLWSTRPLWIDFDSLFLRWKYDISENIFGQNSSITDGDTIKIGRSHYYTPLHEPWPGFVVKLSGFKDIRIVRCLPHYNDIEESPSFIPDILRQKSSRTRIDDNFWRFFVIKSSGVSIWSCVFTGSPYLRLFCPSWVKNLKNQVIWGRFRLDFVLI